MLPIQTTKITRMFAFVSIIIAVLIIEQSDQFLLSKRNGPNRRRISGEKTATLLLNEQSVEFTDEHYMTNYDTADGPRFKRYDAHVGYVSPQEQFSGEPEPEYTTGESEQTTSSPPNPRLQMTVIMIVVGILIVAMIFVGFFICYLLMRDEKETAAALEEVKEAAAQMDQQEIPFVSQQESEKERPAKASVPVSSRSEREETADTGSLAEQLMETFLSDTSRSKRSRSQSVA